MNVYRTLGDSIATIEARDLAEQLVQWHDAMVNHLRAVNIRGVRCEEGCPHEQARGFWVQALAMFGTDAAKLGFLRTYGDRRLSRAVTVRAEARA